MDLHRAGLALFVVTLLVLTGLLIVEPLPGSMYELSTGKAGRGTTRGPSFTYYDAANDTTLALFGECDHVPCGDVHQFRGSIREHFPGGLRLVEPEGGAPIVRAPSDSTLDERVPEAGPARIKEDAGAFTISPPFTTRSLVPVLWTYMVAISIAAAGAALAGRLRWTAIGPAAVPFLAMHLARDSVLVLMIFGFVGVLVAATVAGAFARSRPYLSRAIVYAILAFIVAGWVAAQFMPASGSEI